MAKAVTISVMTRLALRNVGVPLYLDFIYRGTPYKELPTWAYPDRGLQHLYTEADPQSAQASLDSDGRLATATPTAETLGAEPACGE